MYRNLSEFIARLEREGELQRVSVPVDPVYEIAEITDRTIIAAHGGTITLSDNTPHGCIFTFTLPLGEVSLHE